MKAVKNMKMNEYEAVIEAALFVAGEEVSLTALADMIEMDKATTKAIVNTLIARYSDENRGMRIIEIGEGYQMCTSPSCFETIRKIYKAVSYTHLVVSYILRGVSCALGYMYGTVIAGFTEKRNYIDYILVSLFLP